MRPMMASLLIASTWLICGVAAADLQHFDDDFQATDWEQVVIAYGVDGSGSGTTSREDAGGNPGAYREVAGNRIPGSANASNVTHIYSFARQSEYAPAALGAATALDISFDARLFEGGAGMVAPALRQGGVIYVGEAQALAEQAWTVKLFLQLEEASFSEVETPNSHPDFSSTGAPILFGFVYIISAPMAEAVESTAGVDNWGLYVVSGAVAEFLINAGLNDAWFNALTAGQGFFITVFPGLGKMFLAWFTYDTERPGAGVPANLGEPGHRWVTAFGDFAGNAAVLNVELTSGGVFNAPDPAPMQQVNYGTITIVFHDCNSATLTYDFPSLGLMGQIQLTRIANDNIPLCEALLAQLQGQ